MKIAVNTRLLLSNRLEGIGWFSYESLKRIVQQHPEHQFLFIFDRPFSDEFLFGSNVEGVIAKPQARHPFLWYLFFDWGVTSILKKHKPDLFISPDGWLSLRTKVPSITVIHDLNFESYPEYIPFLTRKYYHYFFPRFAKKACRIGTVSEYTKQDIANRYGISPGKIDVLYNGANESFCPLPAEEQNQIRQKYSNGFSYFLFIGLIHPRKNLARLIQAFDQYKKESGDDIKLLVVGSKKWWTADIKDAYEHADFREDIIFTGRVVASDLKLIIASCFALTYVSLFEGFGIPIMEAMYSDVPVITSNVTSMPEVGGDAAIYIDPFSVDSIASSMSNLRKNPKLCEELIQKGRIQRTKFSWQKTADRFWQCIEKAMRERKS